VSDLESVVRISLIYGVLSIAQYAIHPKISIHFDENVDELHHAQKTLLCGRKSSQ
jgi:hypothetical protein